MPAQPPSYEVPTSSCDDDLSYQDDEEPRTKLNIQTPYVLSPINMQINLKALLPLRYTFHRFTTPARVRKMCVEAPAKFVRRDGRIVVWAWWSGVVLVHQVYR